MKKLVLLLVFINLVLLSYFNLDRILPSAPKVTAVAINPEKINLLTQQQIEALPKKTAESSSAVPTPAPTTGAAPATDTAKTSDTASNQTTATSCYEWGIFSASSLTGAQSAASNLSLQPTVKEQTSLEAKRFWVYKPPLKSAEAAQSKASELKALGVQELFVLQDSKWKNAISFGVFEDEKLATNLLKELRAKGVKDVVKASRNQGKGHSSLLFKKLTETEVAELKKLKPAFPEANLKEISCN